MIRRLKKVIKEIIEEVSEASAPQSQETSKQEGEAAEPQKAGKPELLILDPAMLGAAEEKPEPDLRVMGLFSEVEQEKIAELVHGLLYMNELNKLEEKEEDRKSIDFYLCTYGGSADDMFALYDVLNIVKETTEVHTIGVGKVMSAGVLLLAAGTKGKRKIGRNCRVMIHAVSAGNVGTVHNLVNELGEIQNLQEAYIDAIVENSNFTKRSLKKLMDRKVNVYLSAEEAIEHGIADILI